MKPLRIAWLLEDAELAGGTRVAMAQADALCARGHRAAVVTKGAAPTWRQSQAEWLYVDDLEAMDGSDFDFVIGTFWTTLAAAFNVAGRRGVHLCQGYEASLTVYQPIKPRIDAAYAIPLPKITVSPHLVEICRPFNEDSTYIGQIVDDVFFRNLQFRNPARLRVLLVGPAEADFKGVDVGYAAVRRARSLGAEFDLVRVSQWPASSDEPAELASEFHVGLSSPAMAEVIAGCDIFLGPSRHQEGFGLPAAEAMASGLPAVLSAIPSFLAFDEKNRDYAIFAAEDDAAGLADGLLRLLNDARLRRHTAERGRAVVEQFRAHHTGERLERYFLERRAR